MLATVALAVYVLPPGAEAGAVEQLLGGRTDIEGEPVALKDALYAGLGAAGHIGPGPDPVQQLLDALAHRQEWAMEVPLAMTGGLSRDHSRMYEALPRARALLA